jgi:hypothetical protein
MADQGLLSCANEAVNTPPATVITWRVCLDKSANPEFISLSERRSASRHNISLHSDAEIPAQTAQQISSVLIFFHAGAERAPLAFSPAVAGSLARSRGASCAAASFAMIRSA